MADEIQIPLGIRLALKAMNFNPDTMLGDLARVLQIAQDMDARMKRIETLLIEIHAHNLKGQLHHDQRRNGANRNSPHNDGGGARSNDQDTD